MREGRTVAEPDEDHQVVDGSFLGRLQDGLGLQRRTPKGWVLTLLTDSLLNLSGGGRHAWLEAHFRGFDLAHLVDGRRDLAVRPLDRIDIAAGDGVLHNRIMIGIMQPVVELVTAGKQMQLLPVGLLHRYWNVMQGSRPDVLRDNQSRNQDHAKEDPRPPCHPSQPFPRATHVHLPCFQNTPRNHLIPRHRPNKWKHRIFCKNCTLTMERRLTLGMRAQGGVFR